MENGVIWPNVTWRAPSCITHGMRHQGFDPHQHGENGHADRNAIIRLAENSQTGVLVEVSTKVVGPGATVPWQRMHDDGIPIAKAVYQSFVDLEFWCVAINALRLQTLFLYPGCIDDISTR